MQDNTSQQPINKEDEESSSLSRTSSSASVTSSVASDYGGREHLEISAGPPLQGDLEAGARAEEAVQEAAVAPTRSASVPAKADAEAGAGAEATKLQFYQVVNSLKKKISSSWALTNKVKIEMAAAGAGDVGAVTADGFDANDEWAKLEAEAAGGGFSRSSSSSSIISDMGQGNEDEQKGSSSTSTSTARPVVGALGRAASVPGSVVASQEPARAAEEVVANLVAQVAAPGRASSSSSILSDTEQVGENANTTSEERVPATEKYEQSLLEFTTLEFTTGVISSVQKELFEQAAAAQKAAAGALTRASSLTAAARPLAGEVAVAAAAQNEAAVQEALEQEVAVTAVEFDANDEWAKLEAEASVQAPKRASSLPVPGSVVASQVPRAATTTARPGVGALTRASSVPVTGSEVEAAAAKAQADKEAAAAEAKKLAEVQLELLKAQKAADEAAKDEAQKAAEDLAKKLAEEAAAKTAAALAAQKAAEELATVQKKLAEAEAAAQKAAEDLAEAQKKAAEDLAEAQKKAAEDLAAAQKKLAEDAATELKTAKAAAQKAAEDLALAQKEVADLKAAAAAAKKKEEEDAARPLLPKQILPIPSAAGSIGGGVSSATPSVTPSSTEVSDTPLNNWRMLYDSREEYKPDDDDEHKEKKSALFYRNFSDNTSNTCDPKVTLKEINKYTEIGISETSNFILRINKVYFEKNKEPTFGDSKILSLSSIDFNSTNIDKKGGFLYGTREFTFSETTKIHISEKSADKLKKYQNELYKTALEELKKATSNQFSDDEAVRDQQLRDLCSKISGTFSTSSTPDIFSILRTQISGTRHPASSSVLDSSSPDKNAIDAIFEKMAVKIADNIVQNRLLEGDYKIQKQPTPPATSPDTEELPAIKITRNNDDKHKTKIKIDATGTFDDSLKFLYINFGPNNQYYLRIELEGDSSSENNKIKEKSLQIFTQQVDRNNKFKSLNLNEPDGKEALKTLKKYKIDIITNPGGVNNIFERTRITVDARNNKIKTKDSNIYSFSAPTPAPAATAPSPAPAATAAAPAITLAKTKSYFACCCSYFFSSSSITATNIHGEYELNKAHGWLYDDKITTDNTTDSHLRQLKPVNHLFSHFYKDNKVTAIETKIKDNSKNTSITLEKSRKWGGFVERTKSSTRTWSRAMIELSQGGVVSSGR